MIKTRCLIIDDEPYAIKLIKSHLKHFEQFEIVAECENAIDAFKLIQTNKIDLIFLDIQMPGINGIEFLKSLTHKPKVIITSAYKEFAIDGFELDVVDFLLKPISIDRFFKAIIKFFDKDHEYLHDINPIEPAPKFDDLFIKDNNKTYRVNPNDIFFIEGMREYIKVLTNNERIVAKCSLTKFLNQLPQEVFIRIHKSFIINKDCVRAFTASYVEIDNKKLPIGRSYKIRTMEVLNQN